MNIHQFTQPELAKTLKGDGLYFQTGPFVIRLRTTLNELVDDFAFLYGDYPVVQGHDQKLADYHVRMQRPGGLRRWLKPQVQFLLDGATTFYPFPLKLALALLEWGLNYCVFSEAHQYLIFHSAVVERNGNAMILAAPPGSGKSTLCAAMIHHGWRLFSDEIGLLRREDGTLTPNPRPVNLKSGSIPIIRDYAPQAQFGPELPDTRKGTVAHIRPPTDSVRRAGETATPAWVVFPQYQAGASTRLQPLKKSRALLQLAHSAFNYNLLGVQGFEMLANLIDRVGCYQFTYSSLDEALKLFESLDPPQSRGD